MARENLARAGLSERVALILGDATPALRELTAPFDFVFFDADRLSAPEQLKLLLPKLAPHVFIAADNALSHPQEIAGYLKTIADLQGFDHLVVPVGKGLSLAYRGARCVA
jgi:predicted O-methyltransferase YrrM